jgi:ribonuclease VapC
MQVRRGDDGARDLDLVLAKLRIDIIAVTATQADIARKAFRRYGRGQYAANLNFGFCLRPSEGQFGPIAVQRR